MFPQKEDYNKQERTSSLLLITLIGMLPRNGLAPSTHLFLGLFKAFYLCTRIYLAEEAPLIFVLFALMVILVIYESWLYSKSVLGLIKINAYKLSETKLVDFYKFLVTNTRYADDAFIIQPNPAQGNKNSFGARFFSKQTSSRNLLSTKNITPDKIIVKRLCEFISDCKSGTTSPAASAVPWGIFKNYESDFSPENESKWVNKLFQSIEITSDITSEAINTAYFFSNISEPLGGGGGGGPRKTLGDILELLINIRPLSPVSEENSSEGGLLKSSVSKYWNQQLLNFQNITLSTEGVYSEEASQEKKHLTIQIMKYNEKIGEGSKGEKAVWLLVLKDRTKSIEFSRMKELDAFKDRLLATIVHDMRSPLNLVLDMINREGTAHLGEEQRAYFKRIAQINVKMLLSMVNDLLDYSLFKENKMRLIHSRFSLNELLEDAVSMIEFQAKHKGISIVIKNEYKKNEINTDERRLKQVIINLLSNSLKFTREGNITLCVENVPHRKALLFIVTDTGMGVKPEHIKKLCTPFETFDNEGGDNKNGIGLGLFIVKTIVSQLGPLPELDIKSVPGKGTRIAFMIYKDIERKERSVARSRNTIITITGRQSSAQSKEIITLTSPFERFNSVKRKIQSQEHLTIRRPLTYCNPSSLKHISESYTSQDEIRLEEEMSVSLSIIEESITAPYNEVLTIEPRQGFVLAEKKEQKEEIQKELLEVKFFNDVAPTKINVLIADDNVFNILVLESQLKSLSLPIEVSILRACNGEEAVEIFSQRNSYKMGENQSC